MTKSACPRCKIEIYGAHTDPSECLACLRPRYEAALARIKYLEGRRSTVDKQVEFWRNRAGIAERTMREERRRIEIERRALERRLELLRGKVADRKELIGLLREDLRRKKWILADVRRRLNI